MVFHVFPTALEISMVCGILVSYYLLFEGLDVDGELTPLDVSIWVPIRSNHSSYYGRLHGVYYYDNSVANKV